VLVTFLVRGTRAIRPANGAMSAERSSWKKSVSGLKRACSLISVARIHPKEQINGWREITASEVASRLAKWVAVSSQRTRGTKSSHVGFSAVVSPKGGGFMSLNISKPQTPKCRWHPSRARSIKGSLSRPSEVDTWRARRLSAFPPIVVSKRKEQLPHIRECQKAPLRVSTGSQPVVIWEMKRAV
jgi:hypothetical protein